MRKSLSSILIVFIIVSFLFFIVSTVFNINPFQGVFQLAFRNSKAGLYQWKTQSLDSDEVKRLKKENEKLTEKLIDYQKIKLDNEALRSQFQDSPIPQQQLLPVHVIGVVGNSKNPQALIIDRGEKDGVKTGHNVILGKNLVGIVTTVSPYLAHVMLPTNTAFNTLGKTLQDNSSGIIRGQNDFILLDTVVITDKLRKGDLVITKGEIKSTDNQIISNLIVGKISSINKIETKPFQTAQVEPSLDYSRINLLFVVMGER